MRISLIALLALSLMSQSGFAGSQTTHTVCAKGCDFSSIQAAVDYSRPGDTIDLASGVFKESVIVDKPLTFSGAGPDRTAIEGSEGESVFLLEGDTPYNVEFSQLTVLIRMPGAAFSSDGVVSLRSCVIRDESGAATLIKGDGHAALTDTLLMSELKADRRGTRGVARKSASERDAAGVAADSSVTLCHVPPGNPDNAQTIMVGPPAVAAHLRHGDALGPCPGEPVNCDPNTVECSDPPPYCAHPYYSVPSVQDGCWGSWESCVSFSECAPYECFDNSDCMHPWMSCNLTTNECEVPWLFNCDLGDVWFFEFCDFHCPEGTVMTVSGHNCYVCAYPEFCYNEPMQDPWWDEE